MSMVKLTKEEKQKIKQMMNKKEYRVDTQDRFGIWFIFDSIVYSTTISDIIEAGFHVFVSNRSRFYIHKYE